MARNGRFWPWYLNLVFSNREVCITLFWMRYDDSIELNPSWPERQDNTNEMSVSGFIQWSASYFEAANVLYASEGRQYPKMHFAGPTMQMTGLSAELALKGLLRGGGTPENKLKRYSHNTYSAYLDARYLFSEVAFIELVFTNTAHLKTPQEVLERLKDEDDDPHILWRVFFGQLQILDEIYDRPYRSRYIEPGPIVLPEPYVILVGVKRKRRSRPIGILLAGWICADVG